MPSLEPIHYRVASATNGMSDPNISTSYRIMVHRMQTSVSGDAIRTSREYAVLHITARYNTLSCVQVCGVPNICERRVGRGYSSRVACCAVGSCRRGMNRSCKAWRSDSRHGWAVRLQGGLLDCSAPSSRYWHVLDM